jgi:predicted DsbA family dithiol-disulfide isomerase
MSLEEIPSADLTMGDSGSTEINSGHRATIVAPSRCDLGMPDIKVYFDYVCPYCLIAHENVRKFQAKFPAIGYDWKPWEICPETPTEGIVLDFGCVSPTLAKLAEEAGFQIHPPSIQPNSHMALMSLFYAKENGRLEQYNSAVFKALWEGSKNIGELETISRIMGEIGLDSTDYNQAMKKHRDKYAAMLEESESNAIDDDVQLAPTFVFGEKRIVGNVSARKIDRFIEKIAVSQ